MAEKKRSAKWLIYVCAILLVMISIIFISTDNFLKQQAGKGGEDGGDTELAAFQTIRVILDGNPNASHAYLFAAEEQGFLREQGLRLELIVPKSSDDALAIVNGGQAELALVPQPEVLIARSRNVPVVSFAAIMQRPFTFLAVTQDNPIHSPRHLAGKTVGYAHLPTYEAVIRTMMAEDEAEPQQAKLTPVGETFGPLLVGNAVDAVFGANIYHDRLLLEKRGIHARFIDSSLYKVPRYYETVLAAGEQAVEADPELYDKLWTAIEQGYRYVREHPDEAAQMIKSRLNPYEQLSEQQVAESLRLVLSAMEPEEEAFGYQSDESWSDVQNWLEDIEMTDSSLDADDAFLKRESEQ